MYYRIESPILSLHLFCENVRDERKSKFVPNSTVSLVLRITNNETKHIPNILLII